MQSAIISISANVSTNVNVEIFANISKEFKLNEQSIFKTLPWKEYPVKYGVMFNVETAIDTGYDKNDTNEPLQAPGQSKHKSPEDHSV